jgi:hypothetical protein
MIETKTATEKWSGYPTEAADGTPHLTYFEDGVSFVWSGNIERPIQVCPGGDGEPVADTIWPPDYFGLADPWPAPLVWFRKVCDQWLADHASEAFATR